LTLTTGLGVLVVVGKTGTGVIEGVDEEEGSSTGSLGILADVFADEDGVNLHHQRPSYQPSTWRIHHVPS
jgi:hypothetical protein